MDLPAAIIEASQRSSELVVLKEFSFETSRQNQLVFFFKPEVLLLPEWEHRVKMVRIALSLFAQYEVDVGGCAVVSGSLLARTGIMERHYGTINFLSRRASRELTGERADMIRRLAGAAADTLILGGHEYLEFSHDRALLSLRTLWRPHQSKRVRSGLYVQLVDCGAGPIVLVNGFHPAHLAHFLNTDHRIVLFLLNSDCPWGILRAHMLGDTFPERALPGSLRQIFRVQAPLFGLGEIDTTMNCAHLSAGPFEALFELKNFFGGALGIDFEVHDARLAQLMSIRGLCAWVSRVLENPVIKTATGTESLFNLTEGIDSMASIELLHNLLCPTCPVRSLQ